MPHQCIYCLASKDESDFSDEHIWPDALGGDFLSAEWRTVSVCKTCNSLSGVFVDGAFIKSWIGSAERSTGAREYLQLNAAQVGRLPLNYLGRVKSIPAPSGMMVDYWAGPCGANILHFRPEDKEDIWGTYAGGDPRAKKGRAGRAYVSLTSHAPFWIMVSLASFAFHFGRTKKRIITEGLTNAYLTPYNIEQFDPDEYAEDAKYIAAFLEASRSGDELGCEFAIDLEMGKRMLCKVALGFGCNSLGPDFAESPSGNLLRRAFREADPAKRSSLEVRGTGFLNGVHDGSEMAILAWTGAWVLLVLETPDQELVLTVISPAGKIMTIVITDDPNLISATQSRYRDGVVWLTVPSLGEAVNAVGLPEYVAHKTSVAKLAALSRLEAFRHNPDELPLCG